MQRILLVLSASVLLLGVTVSAVACGSSSSSTTAATVVSSTTNTQVTTSATTQQGLQKLVLVAPPGPMAIPMAYMVDSGKLNELAAEVQLMVWENAEQLKAVVAGGQGHFVTMPTNNAAVFYNRGLSLKLLDVSVWNITYLLSTDSAVQRLGDLRGRDVIVSLKGSVPDVMFRTMLKRSGIDPEKDLTIIYATDPTQAAQMFLAGKASCVVMSEAQATSVILKTKDTSKPARRVFDFASVWTSLFGSEARSPIAGTCATQAILEHPEIVAKFLNLYAEAIQWTSENPEDGGRLLEQQLPDLGITGALMGEAAHNIEWKYVPAASAREYLERFYTELATLSPEVIGDKLPDEGFYFLP